MTITAEAFKAKTQKGTLAVRPFLDGAENMGLEKYNMVIFPNTVQVDQLICIEKNGVPRYITGLDEFAPEIVEIKDPEMREARIRFVRETVSELEAKLNSNQIDPSPKNKDFWNQVELLKPNNSKFWDRVTIDCKNEPTFLNPKEPLDLIKIIAIQNGGFSLIGKSYDDARSLPQPPKWYLDSAQETAATKIEGKKLRNKATSLLEELHNSNKTKFLLVAKLTALEGSHYKYSTPTEVLYEDMDEFIHGRRGEKNEARAANLFITNATEFGMDELKLRAIVRDAAFYNIIHTKGNGLIYHTPSNTMMGRNNSEVVEFLKNPVNDDFLSSFMHEVEKYWNE